MKPMILLASLFHLELLGFMVGWRGGDEKQGVHYGDFNEPCLHNKNKIAIVLFLFASNGLLDASKTEGRHTTVCVTENAEPETFSVFGMAMTPVRIG